MWDGRPNCIAPAIDKNGDQEPLLWPPFHPELLKSGNNAGDLYGRVVVVISEGFARPHRSPPIERVRDIMAFSFRHAPLRMHPTSWETGKHC